MGDKAMKCRNRQSPQGGLGSVYIVSTQRLCIVFAVSEMSRITHWRCDSFMTFFEALGVSESCDCGLSDWREVFIE